MNDDHGVEPALAMAAIGVALPVIGYGVLCLSLWLFGA